VILSLARQMSPGALGARAAWPCAAVGAEDADRLERRRLQCLPSWAYAPEAEPAEPATVPLTVSSPRRQMHNGSSEATVRQRQDHIGMRRAGPWTGPSRGRRRLSFGGGRAFYIRVIVILAVLFSCVTAPSGADPMSVPLLGQLKPPSIRVEVFLPATGLRVVMALPAPTAARPVRLSVAVPYLHVTGKPKIVTSTWKPNLASKWSMEVMFGSVPSNPS
jgi:hypothetical protein